MTIYDAPLPYDKADMTYDGLLTGHARGATRRRVVDQVPPHDEEVIIILAARRLL